MFNFQWCRTYAADDVDEVDDLRDGLAVTAHHDDEAVGESADAEQGRLTQQGLGAERRTVLLRQRLEQILKQRKKGVSKTICDPTRNKKVC